MRITKDIVKASDWQIPIRVFAVFLLVVAAVIAAIVGGLCLLSKVP